MENLGRQLHFTVPGPPVGKQRHRPRFGGGKPITPAKTRSYEKHVRVNAWVALNNARDWLTDFEGYFRLTIDIYFANKNRPDTSNVLKSIEDGCNGVIWKDDKMVVSGTRDIFFSKKPRVEVFIEPYEPKEE